MTYLRQMRLLQFILIRIFGMVVALIAVVAASYTVLFFKPGGMYDSLVSSRTTGIFASYLQNLTRVEHDMFTLNFHMPLSRVESALGTSAMLAVGSILIAAVIGLPIGVIAAVRQRNILAHVASTGGLVAQGIPAFTLAVILQLCFAVFWPILPLDGWNSPLSAVLPMCTLAASNVGYMAKFMQSGMNEALGEDFVMSAKARGLPEWKVVLRHALRPALITVVTFFGPQTAVLIASTVVIETVFEIPGLSTLFGQGLMAGGMGGPMGGQGDITMGVGSMFLLAVMVMLLNLFVDLVYRVLNPRMTT